MTTDSQPEQVATLSLWNSRRPYKAYDPNQPGHVEYMTECKQDARDVLAALRDAGYAVVRPDAWGKWLTLGTAHYDHLSTKCILAGWVAYRQSGSDPDRSDAVVRATLNTVRTIFATAERGES